VAHFNGIDRQNASHNIDLPRLSLIRDRNITWPVAANSDMADRRRPSTGEDINLSSWALRSWSWREAVNHPRGTSVHALSPTRTCLRTFETTTQIHYFARLLLCPALSRERPIQGSVTGRTPGLLRLSKADHIQGEMRANSCTVSTFYSSSFPLLGHYNRRRSFHLYSSRNIQIRLISKYIHNAKVESCTDSQCAKCGQLKKKKDDELR
jgi:hypothetical protein